LNRTLTSAERQQKGKPSLMASSQDSGGRFLEGEPASEKRPWLGDAADLRNSIHDHQPRDVRSG
jgi:hypothetical protein